MSLIPDNNEERVQLTPEQEIIILEMIQKNPDEPPLVKDIIEKVFGQKHDARTKWGIAVREFIAAKGLKFRNARTWVPEKAIELTEEQKQFIANNCSVTKPLEMARTLFDNRDLTMFDVETRAIYDYIKTLPSKVRAVSLEKGNEIVQSDYRPPKTDEQVLNKINKYVNNAGINIEQLTEKQKRDIKNLIGYLHTLRFLSQIKTYSLNDDRDLFESEFIRCTYDKDLTEEEVDQYILYSKAVVYEKQISKRIEQFEREQDQVLEETGKISMPMVESINTLRQDLDKCITQQKTLLKSLQGERKERLKLDSANKGNIADLIMYAQSEEKRMHLMKLAEERRQKLKDEINRIKSMSEIKAEIYGVHEDEILD